MPVRWSEEEWLLVLDLFERAEKRPTDDMVEQLRHELRGLGLKAKDPNRRRAAHESSYRSVGSIWNHLSAVRAMAEGRLRYPPVELELLWPRYQEDPGEIRIEAARIREASGLGAGMNQPPADELKSFLYDVHELIDGVVRTISVLPGSNASPEDVRAYVAAWEELNQRPLLEVISAELDTADAIPRLGNAGLLGAQLAAKLDPFRRWLAEWRSARSLESLQRALQRANVVLGSLASVLPGLEALKEFKETTEAMLDEAVPRGGYLPAPAIA